MCIGGGCQVNNLSAFYKIYLDIYGKIFNYFDNGARTLIQFTVFLYGIYTQEDEYDFIMLNNGVFSQNLQNDLFLNEKALISSLNLSEKQKLFVSFMKNIIWNKPRTCNINMWMFYLSSIIYCKRCLNICGEEMMEFIRAQASKNFDEKLFNSANKIVDTMFF